jgi:hypothetical protein
MNFYNNPVSINQSINTTDKIKVFILIRIISRQSTFNLTLTYCKDISFFSTFTYNISPFTPFRYVDRKKHMNDSVRQIEMTKKFGLKRFVIFVFKKLISKVSLYIALYKKYKFKCNM